MSNAHRPYNIESTLEENVLQGPPQIPTNIAVPESSPITWLNMPLRSPLGISASPLTMNKAWVEWGAKMGYDFLTFKTVRSRKWDVHPFPNWMHVDESSFDQTKNQIQGRLSEYSQNEISMANSFGVQSSSPEEWVEEYESAKTVLNEGQCLVLSVMPSVIDGIDILNDVDQLADLANQTSAEIIEMNLACPNSAHNLIYLDLDLATEIAKRFRKRLNPDKKLIIKISYYKNQNDAAKLITDLRDVVSGITSINTMGMKVINTDGESAFDINRPSAGISGAIVRPYSLKQMDTLVATRQKLGLEKELGLIAVGGVSKPEHIYAYLSLGQNIIVQAATGVLENPNLAIEFKTFNKEQ